MPSAHPMLRRTRSVLFVVLATASIAACGDAGLFDGLGERGHEYVRGSTTTTLPGSETPIETRVTLTAVEDVRWYNEEIPGESEGDANFVVSAVWNRGDGVTRFIQASPTEIATALPGVEFPSLVPNQTFSITSQLVYDTASATLDVGTAAAFGMWPVTPYAIDSGSIAVLRVAFDDGSGLGGPEVRTVVIDDGISLKWTSGAYSYELSCVSEIPESVCQQMAASAVSLELIAP